MMKLLPPLAAAVGLLLLPGLPEGEPLQVFDRGQWLLGLGFAAAYLVTWGLEASPLLPAAGPLGPLVRAVGLASCAAVPTLAALMAAIRMLDTGYATLTLAAEVSLYYALVVVTVLTPRRMQIAGSVLVVAVCVYPAVVAEVRGNGLALVLEAPKAQYTSELRYVGSSLHDLAIRRLRLPTPGKIIAGGAFAQVREDQHLLMTGDGRTFLVTRRGEGLHRTALDWELPMNRREYVGAVDNPSQFFRITDLMLVPEGEGAARILLAHHRWNADGGCVELAVSETTVIGELADSRPAWTPRFASQPCREGLTMHTGGIMASLGDGRILLTVGDSAPGVTADAQDPEVSYGKILALDTRDWSVQQYSRGHRNPQGLAVTEAGIWSTEHGPQGGDELNQLVEGGNYGWPDTTYGTEYGRKTWRGSSTPGRHEAGLRPLYAWVPSIGITQVVKLRGDAFAGWAGDLLVGSLTGGGNGHSLYRVRVEDGRVQLVERIEIGVRVRDLVELADGALLIWDGRYAMHLVTPGAHVFSACSGCHGLRRNSHDIGPDLFGIVGSDVARRRNFAYSAAMREAAGKWTRERLDAFLRDPQAHIPGTTMEFRGLSDADARMAVIEYLDKLAMEEEH